MLTLERPVVRALALRKGLGIASVMPHFDITIKNAGRSKTVSAGFDTGMNTADLEIPSSLASALGIVPTKFSQVADTSKVYTQKVGFAEEISVPSAPGCTLKQAAVNFSDELTQVLIGSTFFQSVGGEISYEGGSPVIKCTGSKSLGVLAPAFNVTLSNGVKVLKAPALFDTGFSADLSLGEDQARQMGLVVTGYEDARTHTGTVRLGIASMERLSVSDVPTCQLMKAKVMVMPASSPLQNMLVGESFLRKVGGKVGYDQAGAYFTCLGAASGQLARPVAFSRVSAGIIPDLSSWEGIAAAVLGAVGLLSLGAAIASNLDK